MTDKKKIDGHALMAPSFQRYYVQMSNQDKVEIPRELGALLDEYDIRLMIDICEPESESGRVWLVESQDPDEMLFFLAASLDAAWRELLRREEMLEDLKGETICLTQWEVVQ